MPFELGLAAAIAQNQRHRWFVLEARPYRLQKSLSDVNGYDPFIHQRTSVGVLRALKNAFITTRKQPSVDDLVAVNEKLSLAARALRTTRYGARSVFEASVFEELVGAAMAISKGLGIP